MFALRRLLPVAIAAATVALFSDMSARAQVGPYEPNRVIVRFLNQAAPGDVDRQVGPQHEGVTG